MPLPIGPCESQTWKIITKQKATSGPSFQEEVDLFQVDMRNRAEYETRIIDDLDYGFIHKEFSNCVKEFLGRGCNYRVRFPRTATVDQKTLLIAAGMMMDMNFYDTKWFPDRCLRFC